MWLWINYIIKLKFILAFKATFKATFIEQNIKAGFRAIRLVLYNLERVILYLNL